MLCPGISFSISAEFHGVAAQDLLIASGEGNAHPEFLILHIIEIADEQQRLFLFPAAAHKHNHALLLITAIDPLKALRIKIQLIERRVLPIERVQRPHVVLHFLVNRILQQLPLQRLVFIPLIHLGVVLSHKQQLLSRVRHHKAIGRPQILCLLLKGIPRHFADHRTLSVNHLVMRKYQHKILTVGIQHGEGQLPVIILAEVGIAAHKADEIIHPAHIPLIIEAKSAVPGITRNHRPRRRLLCDQNRPVFASLQHCIQMLQELNRLQVLIAAIQIGNPFSVALPVIQIQHRGHRIHTNSVRMVLINPEKRVGNQEI